MTRTIKIDRRNGERWHGYLRAGIWERLPDSTMPKEAARA